MIEQLTNTDPTNEWIEFDGIAAPLSRSGPRVTLNQEDQMCLGMKAVEALGRPEAVKLFFDARNLRLGIQPSTLDDERAFPVKHKRTHGYVHAKRFCKRFNIITEHTVEYLDAQIDTNGILVLNMRNARRFR